MPRRPPIEAVVVDVGGVVIAIHEQRTARAVAEATGLAPEEILRSITYESATARRLYTGQWTLRDVLAANRSALGEALTYEQLAMAWLAMLGEDLPGVRAALEALPAKLPLYVLSNTLHEHMPALRQHWLFGRCRRFFASCEIGLCKPERAVYEYLLAQVGQPPARVLFFDDNLPNVKSARACGIRTVHVTGPQTLPATLARLGLIPNAS